MEKKPTLIVIAGPTAVGKTSMAIRLAQHYHTAIISADSRQCFQELNIGVARPSPEELATVPHYFINSHTIHEKVDAAVFEKYALATADQLFQQHDVVIVTGGTGMYLKAFVEGLDAIPDVDTAIQQQVRSSYEEKGLAWLRDAVATEDAAYFANGEMQNPQRLMRALEVVRSTGKSILHYQQRKKVERPFRIIKTALELPREMLNNQIIKRVNVMVEAGLIQEAEALLPYQHMNALQTVGYQELFDYFNGKLTLTQAIEQIKIHTRQYAKRQMTWFKKDAEIKWFDGGDWTSLQSYVDESIR